MKELLFQKKGKFTRYLIAAFMFNIEHFMHMGLSALILGFIAGGKADDYYIVVIVVAVICVYSAINFIVSRMMRIGYMRDTILEVRKRAFAKIMRMSYKSFSKKSKDTYLSNLINDINQFEDQFFISLLNFIINVSMFVMCTVLLVILEPILSVAMVAASLLLFLISALFSKKTIHLNEDIAKANETYTTEISNTFQGLEILKLNRIEDRFLQKNLDTIKRTEHRKFLFSSFSDAQQNVTRILAYVIMCGIMAYLCIRYDSGLNLAAATMIFQVSSSMTFYLIEAFPLWNRIRASVAIYHRITDDEAEENTTVTANAADKQEFSFRESLTASHLSFAYDKQEILKDASFTIEPGKKYLIKGVSGAGKSTLLNLLSMTYDNYGGEITADGVSYRNIREASFHDKVAFIYQDVFLFEDTLRNNLTLYKEVPEERLNFAIHSCQLESVIHTYPNGLSEVLEENGKNLSGGQRQRISIARAIAKDAELLFVDEGTSGLNEELGREIEQLFLSLPQTVIAISHRYYSGVTENYDYVLEIKNGHIRQYPSKDYFGEAVTC